MLYSKVEGTGKTRSKAVDRIPTRYTKYDIVDDDVEFAIGLNHI